MAYDYKRNGTTTLFAVLEVATGKVIGRYLPKHRHDEFLRSCAPSIRTCRPSCKIHLILDNYATHKHADVTKWLDRHPRSTCTSPPIHLHFTPDLVERWVRELTEKALRRGIFRNVPDLIDAIEHYMSAPNDQPKPLVWTASAESIPEKSPADASPLTG